MYFAQLLRRVALKYDALSHEDAVFIQQFNLHMDDRFLARKKCLMLEILRQSKFDRTLENLARDVGVSKPTVRSWMTGFVEENLSSFLNSSKLVTRWDEGETKSQREPLTSSEVEIILDLVNGLAPKQIATKRSSALSTIYNRLRIIRDKIGHQDILAWAHQQSGVSSNDILEEARRRNAS